MSDNKKSEFKQEKNLEDLMNIASENSNVDEVSSVEKSNKKTNKKAFTVAFAGMGVLFVTVIALAVLLKGNQEFEDKTKDPDWVNDESSSIVSNETEGEFGFERPIDIQEWAMTPYEDSLLENDEFLDNVEQEAVKYPAFYSAISWMPSSKEMKYEGAPEPYTNDTFEAYLEDGSDNPLFSYTLMEDYQNAYIIYINRLINPVFGGWDLAERSGLDTISHRSLEPLSQMFSEEWISNNIVKEEDYSSLPILADWNDDSFGGLNISETVPGRYGKFYGEINETENDTVSVEYIPSDEIEEGEIENSRVNITTPLKFSAFDDKGGVIEKYGSLYLSLGANENVSMELNRVVIKEAKLVVE